MTLIKKQYRECFRGYFVNPKTGKGRSKAGIAGFFLLFGGVMLMLCGIFSGLSLMISDLLEMGLAWLYYALMGMVAVALGVFGSVFNTYSSLYLAKDNELLLPLPIPASIILGSRMSLVFGLSLLYSGSVWLPALVCGWVRHTPSAMAVCFGLLLFLMIALLVTVLTCALGWVVALAAARMKNKSFIVVLVSVVFFAGYYFVCMRMSSFLMLIIQNSEAVGMGVRKWGNFFYQLGCAADGNAAAMAIFSGVTLVLSVICGWVLARSFVKIVTRTASSRVKGKQVQIKSRSFQSALFRRELKRFTTSPNYMLNCGLGILLMPLAAVVFLVKRAALQELLAVLPEELPGLAAMVPLVVFLLIGLITAMDAITAPSVSLEGKHLWVVQSLPVGAAQVLGAKVKLHVTLNIYPAMAAAAVMAYCFGLDLLTAVLTMAALGMFIWLSANLGLILGLLNPNLNWTSETMALKGLNVLIVMLVNWLMVAAVAVIFWLLRDKMPIEQYLAMCTAVFVIAARLTRSYLAGRGAARFAAL